MNAASGPTIRQHTPFDGYCAAPVLNGIDSYISLGNPESLNFSGSITLEAWVRVRATDGVRNILSHGFMSNPDREVALRVKDGQYQVGCLRDTSHYCSYPVPTTDLEAWVHLAGVFDGTRWMLFRNGVQVSAVASPIGAMEMSVSWAIGSNGAGTSQFFDGHIRNAAVFKVARSMSTINRDMWGYPDSDADGLMGYWEMSEGSGDLVSDLSPTNNPGELVNVAWHSPLQSPPNTLAFDGIGVTGHVDLGNPAHLNFAGAITLMAWIYPVAKDGTQNIIAHGSSLNPNAGVYLRIDQGYFQVGSWDGTSYSTRYAIQDSDLSSWIHLAGRYDGARWALYKDGVPVADSPASTGAVRVSNSWAIGSNAGGMEKFFRGFIAQTGIFNRALTESEIAKCISQPDFAERNAVGFWNLHEGAGDILFDSSTNNVDGTAADCFWVATGGPPGWTLLNASADVGDLSTAVAASGEMALWVYAGQGERAVYSTFDGVAWENIQSIAPWAERTNASGVYYRNYLWLMGGEGAGHTTFNDIWNSLDGIAWNRVLAQAPWSARASACLVVFDGVMWLFGGRDSRGNTCHDVWRSLDGKSWRQATSDAAWSPRQSAAASVLNGEIWLMAGNSGGTSMRDAWHSADGETWTQAPTPPWSSRSLARAVTIGQTIYLIGGVNDTAGDLNDMWSTSDGSRWARIRESAPWSKREQQVVAAFDNQIILAGGTTSGGRSLKDTWRFNPRAKRR